MYSYVTEELPALIAEKFPRGHEPAGHFRPFHGRPRRLTGAETSRALQELLGFRADRAALDQRLVAPGAEEVPGPRRKAWRDYDTTLLIADGTRFKEFLVDQGGADTFLKTA